MNVQERYIVWVWVKKARQGGVAQLCDHLYRLQLLSLHGPHVGVKLWGISYQFTQHDPSLQWESNIDLFVGWA